MSINCKSNATNWKSNNRKALQHKSRVYFFLAHCNAIRVGRSGNGKKISLKTWQCSAWLQKRNQWNQFEPIFFVFSQYKSLLTRMSSVLSLLKDFFAPRINFKLYVYWKQFIDWWSLMRSRGDSWLILVVTFLVSSAAKLCDFPLTLLCSLEMPLHDVGIITLVCDNFFALL